MVLCAGLGTRLRPLSDVRAKPAIPVAGEAMIRRIIRWLAASGVSDVVLNLHHLPDTLARQVGDGSDLSVRARYSWEQPVVLGAAGGPRQALPIIGADRFLLINGDVLTDVDLAALAAAHQDSGARVTLALVPNREPQKYSGVRLAADRSVTGFSKRGETGESFHFVGPQVVESHVFEALPSGRPAASIGGLYDRLIREHPGSIRGYVSDARYWDVGSCVDYWHSSWAFAELEHKNGVLRGDRTTIDSSARLSRSILWDDIEVARNAVLDECIVTDGVKVPAGAQYRRMILLRTRDGAVDALPFVL